ncbi:MAG: pyridoxamine 5'-phosphate oxidase family protein [Planctomycetota bacterium]|nr:pyridoxamine 5'-phosphate oxidase family protein [Planctomycetota bacterium]
MPTEPQPSSERVRIRRLPARGDYDPEAIAAILDEALICHVGFSAGGQVYVIPTIHARVGEVLYLHGSPASRMLKTLAGGGSCCVTVTLLDGVVLARSAFHHSLNYRSVVVLATATEVTDRARKREALHALVEQMIPGRSTSCRMPNDEELRRTTVLELPISEASAKIRTGPPGDDEPDYALDHWAGVIPLRLQANPPVADPALAAHVEMPSHVRGWSPGPGP